MSAKTATKILLVDDEPEVLETTKWAFEAIGYNVFTALTGEEAVEQMVDAKPDLLLIDYKLPQMSGIDFLKLARVMQPDITAIMITGLTHQSEEIEKECEELGTFAFLHKPLSMEEVIRVVKEALAQRSRTDSKKSS